VVRLRRDARVSVERLIELVSERPGSSFSPTGVLTLEAPGGGGQILELAVRPSASCSPELPIFVAWSLLVSASDEESVCSSRVDVRGAVPARRSHCVGQESPPAAEPSPGRA
jgi:hypothetical protein